MKNENTSARTSRRSAGLQSILNLSLVIFLLLLINFIGFKHYSRKDLSASQFYNLSPKTVDVLLHLEAPVRITTLLLNKDKQQFWDQTETLLKEYEHAGGKNISIDKVDPVYDMARAVELQKRLHFDATSNLVIFEYKDHSKVLRQEDLAEVNPVTQQLSGFKGEQQFTSAIVSLVEGKASKVYFTEGHGEHAVTDPQGGAGYGILGESVKGENIETATFNLAQKGEVPADADAVVVAGPSISFSPVEVQALGKYIAGNGKLLLLVDPYVNTGLDEILKTYGMAFDNDLVLCRGLTTSGGQMTVPLAQIYQGGFSPHPITGKFASSNLQMLVQNARSITLLKDDKGQPNTKVQFLLQTDPDAWGWIIKAGTTSADLLSLQDRIYNKVTDLAGPLVVASVYDGGTLTDPGSKATLGATRVVAVGCSRFIQNDTADTMGLNFFSNCLDWLVKKDAVLDINPKKPQEYGITLSPMQLRTVAWTSLFFIPGTALVLGIAAWLSRRR